MLVFVAAALHELRDNLLEVEFFESGNVAHGEGGRRTGPVSGRVSFEWKRVSNAGAPAVWQVRNRRDQAAAVAKEALATGKTLREIVLAKKLMDAATLDRALDPREMTKGGQSALGE